MLTRRDEWLLALAAAVVTANAYYIHPIIGDVADDFGVSHARIGLVPALNQLALAVGIFLLLPLGDRYSNRTLTTIFTIGQTIGLAIMTLAGSFVLFTAGSTLLGFFTIAPYLLPAYASKRIAPERLGQVTALLTVGVIFGILVARVGAGVIAENFGWRPVYWIATSLMIAMTIMLPLVMDKGERERSARGSYVGLLKSLVTIARQHPDIFRAGSIQALNFGTFIALWLGLALHLTSPEMGYGTDTVGYLAALAAVSIFSTPRIGRWADRVGARKARAVLAVIALCGIALYYPLGWNLWLLLVPLILTNLVGPTVDVTSRMTFLALDANLRTRLTTIYIVMMFVGGGLASFAGTWVFDHYDWAGTCALLVTMSAISALLAWQGARRT